MSKMRWVAAGALFYIGCTTVIARPAPSRVPWTTSHVHGSPDAPMPFQVERIVPKLSFKQPVDIAYAPGTGRAFVVELEGRIVSFPQGLSCEKADLAIDLRQEILGLDRVPDCKGINQAFGITFHPDFAKNHNCYVCYVLARKSKGVGFQNGSRVSRFTVTIADPPKIDPASEVVLFDWYGGGHNGGCLKFGPDGFLYISTGDGADPDPPDSFNTGQDINDLLSSILRVDVDHPEGAMPYSIPKDNPFVTIPGARPEVWAFGLRNPWRMSFDRSTGQLWAGDVGWELWEMIDRIERGGNYGWSLTEGPQPVHPKGRRGPGPILKPVLVLPHSESASVTGGYVYRGRKLPALSGQYVFGDWETRRIWAAKCEGPDGERLAPYRQIAQTDLRVIAFGEDPEGELSVLDFEGGGLYRIVPNSQPEVAGPFPRKLSDTGLFSDLFHQVPAPGVVPFAINASQWNDGAAADRFVAIPGNAPVTRTDKQKVFPKDSVLVRTFSLENEAKGSEEKRRVETQLLHFDGRRWNGYSYQWNKEQTDADLVDALGAEITLTDASAASQKSPRTWTFPSRAQCATCHTSWVDYTLAFDAAQLDRRGVGSESSENQLAALRRKGLFPEAAAVPSKDQPSLAPLADPHDDSADLDARARAYLHVNCAHCHRVGGGGSALIDLRNGLDIRKTLAVDVQPMLGSFGMSDARIIAPGEPERSVLLYRMAKAGRGHMPHIGAASIDDRGLELIQKWIRQMPAVPYSLPANVNPDESVAKHREAVRSIATGVADSPEFLHGVDVLLKSTDGAMAILCAIEGGLLRKDLRDAIVSRAGNSEREAVRELFEPFIPPEQRQARLGENFDPAILLKAEGDASRGRHIFFDIGGAGLCQQCHQIDGQGRDVGPDLTHIGAKYDRAALLDSILHPSKAIEPQYVAYAVTTQSGDDHLGLLVEKTASQVTLKEVQGNIVRIPSSQIQKMTPQTTSIMPEGILSACTKEQAADLLAFLHSHK